MPTPRFYVGTKLPAGAALPALLLTPSDWDDYSYRTRFALAAFIESTEARIVIGDVKILRATYPERTSDFSYYWTKDFIGDSFESLDADQYCSLGQSSDYYANLHTLSSQGLDANAGSAIAAALNDVCLASQGPEHQWFIGSPGYDTSLLRFASAYLALRDGAALLRGEVPSAHVVNSIPLSALGGGSFSPTGVELQFDGNLRVPGRVNVVVGKNGAGKTYFLSRLAEWIGGPRTQAWDRYQPHFSRVVLVSSNTFDRGRRVSVADAGQSVRYVGTLVANWDDIERTRALAANTPDEEWLGRLGTLFPTRGDLLKVLPAVEDETAGRLVELQTNLEWQGLAARLFEEEELGRRLVHEPRAELRRMSAGQRALATLYSGIFQSLDKQGLVLLDEPENFLHPSLIAKFIRNLNDLLATKSAFAVIATHSPIVVQETPRRFVWVMERGENDSQFSRPNFETFGETVENIDEYLFETDFRSSHWKRVLRDFVKERLTNEEIQQRVGAMELSLAARAYLERQRAKHESETGGDEA